MNNFEKIKEYEAHKEEVPTYEEYIAMKKLVSSKIDTRNNQDMLLAENTKLKELLKKANKFLKDYGFTFDGKDCAEAFKVHTKINQVLGE